MRPVYYIIFIGVWANRVAYVVTSDDQNVDTNDVSINQYLDTIIKRYGYRGESHVVETEDGYLLTLYRISANRNGTKGSQPVFLQHGLRLSSTVWVDSGNRSLAFMLSDLGYDVWLGNARGSTSSRGHVSLPLPSAQYWNFSFYEMAIYDLPTAIHHVANMTGRGGEIIYVGHSMGTTMFFILASMFPDFTRTNIKFMAALAPVAYMTHVKSRLRYLSPLADNLDWLAKRLGINEYLPTKVQKLFGNDCRLLHISKTICKDIIFQVYGFDKDQFVEKMIPVALAHFPAGTSFKTIVHYVQEIRHRGDFREYDYGTKGNLRQYGTKTPPLYNISSIDTPIYLVYADNDVFASPIDVKRLAKNLRSQVEVYEVPYKKFNHLDFIWGKDAPTLVYKPLIEVMKKYFV